MDIHFFYREREIFSKNFSILFWQYFFILFHLFIKNEIIYLNAKLSEAKERSFPAGINEVYFCKAKRS